MVGQKSIFLKGVPQFHELSDFLSYHVPSQLKETEGEGGLTVPPSAFRSKASKPFWSTYERDLEALNMRNCRQPQDVNRYIPLFCERYTSMSAKV